MAEKVAEFGNPGPDHWTFILPPAECIVIKDTKHFLSKISNLTCHYY